MRPVLALACMMFLSGCITFSPVASGRPMNVAHTSLGQSRVVQDNKLIAWDDAAQELQRVDAAAEDARSASRWATAGTVTWLSGAAVIGIALGMSSDRTLTHRQRGLGWAVMGGGVAISAGGAWAWSVATHRMESAVSRYNKALEGSASETSAAGLRFDPLVLVTATGDRSPCRLVGFRASF
jgi:hypothetical protein